MPICFATNNTHKIEEVKAILGNGFSLLSLNDVGCREELPEEQETIEGNSFQKASYVFNNYHVACFADDSGLEVAALKNAPGVHSAYYAGMQRSHDDNMALLVKNMTGEDDRHAHFKTVITLVSASGVHQFEGILKGMILTEKRGQGGFGYDPVFLPEGYSKTLAEMSPGEKNEISHRSIAVQKLIRFIKANPD
jgi:XTP/dITP diphosphohydrolase